MIITHNGTILKHDGTILTKITEVPPQPPFTNTYSLDFDGVDETIFCGIDASRQVQTLTMSVWVKPTAFARDGIVLNGHVSYGNQGIEIYWNFNQFGVRINGSTYGLGSGNGQNNWSHILVAYDGNTLKRMTNGVPLADVVIGATINYTNYNGLTIGRSPYGFHIGNIDEFAFWNSDQSANFSTIYGTGVPNDLTDLSPIAWYRNGDNGSYKSPQWLLPNNENKDKVSNYSFELDGLDDYITVSNAVLSSAGDMTISCWANFTSLSSVQGIFDSTNYYLNGFNGGFSFRTIGANLDVAFSNGTSFDAYSATAGLSTSGGWYHLAFTFDNTTKVGTFYKNGVSIGTHTYTGFDNADLANGGVIGRTARLNNYCFTGLLDEIVIFDSVKDATAINDIYNGGEPTTISGAIAHWRMGEEANFTSNWLVDNSALTNYSKRSFSFDGMDDKIELGTQSLGITGAISVSAWVKIPTTNTGGGGTNIQQIVCEDRAGGTGRNWLLYWRGGSQNIFGCSIFDSLGTAFGASTNSVVPNDNQWHHVMFTYAGDTSTDGLKLFVDGIQRAQATSVNGGLRSSPTIKPTIGGLSNTLQWMFEGNIDEVAIFNTDQSSNVSTIYNSGIPNDLTELSPLHWYRMGEDASFNGTNWIVPDNVGSNNGTSDGMMVDALVGEAPNYSGGGISEGMTIEDRVGNAPNSENNALSYNMEREDRVEDTP